MRHLSSNGQGNSSRLNRRHRRRAAQALIATAAMLSASTAARAVDRYFDLASTSGLLGGTSNWDTTTQSWSATSAGTSNPLLAWEQGADAWFNNAASNNLTLYGTIWANSITSVSNGAAGVGTVINPAAADALLQIGAGGINSRSGQPSTFHVNVDLLADQTWNLSSALVVNGVISSAGGAFGLTKTGTNSLGLSGANTFTGAMNVNAGMISLFGGGTVTSASAVNVFGVSSTASFGGSQIISTAVLKIDNTGTDVDDRIGDTVDLTLGRLGELWLLGHAATNTAETIGDLRLDTGHATVSIEAGAGVTTLSAATLQRANHATAVIRGTGLGQKTTAVAKVALGTTLSGADFVGAGGAASGVGSTKNLAIVPWLLGDSNSTFGGRDFVTYDAAATLSSLRTLVSSEYAVLTAGSTAYTTTGENVQIGAVNLTLSAGARTFNSLLINGSGANLNGAGGVDDTLTIDSGAIAQVNGNGGTIANFGLITFGNDEAVLSATTVLRLNSGLTVTGSGGLTKTGAGTVVLAADNSYSGATVINWGTLQVGVGGTSGSLGSTSAVSLHGGNLVFNRSDDFSFDAPITGVAVQGNANGGTLRHDGAGHLTLTANNVIPGALSVAGGTLTLTGTNVAGQAPVKNGAVEFITNINIPSVIGTSASSIATLNVAGSGSLSVSTGDLKVGDVVSGAKGRVNIDGTASLAANRVLLGAIGGASGALYQDGGSVNGYGALNTPGVAVGNSAGYGFYQLTAGTLTANMIQVSNGGAATGVGVFFQSGGSVVNTNHMYLTGNGSLGSSVYYMTGGDYTATGTSNTVYLGYTNGNAQMTITDATFSTPGDVSVGTAAGVTAILNLNAGAILRANKVQSDVGSGATGVRHINFDGGTLRYAGAGNQTQFLKAGNFHSVNILDGGATFEIVNNVTATIEQAMLAPTGSGVAGTEIAVVDGGSGYIGAPVVQISGVTGATAVANMVSDGAGGLKVGSITVTTPGLDATSPAFTFAGGGFTSAAVGQTLATAANATSGGISKTGIGILALSKANTYGGATTISAGTLRLTATGSIDNSAGVIVNAGATFDLSQKANGYSVKSLAGAGTVLGVNTKATTVAAGGLLSLGDAGTGDLTVSAGNLVLDGSGLASTITAPGTAGKLRISSSGSPTLSLTGDNDLQLVLDFTPTSIGQTYFLTDLNGSAAIGGVFESVNGVTTDLSQGAEFTVGAVSFAISYVGDFATLDDGLLSAAGNDLALTTTAVPEPAGLGVLALAGSGLLRRRRRGA